MSTKESYTLQAVFRLIERKKILIAKVTVALMLIGAVAYFIFPKRYKAETIFVLKSPRYAERSNVYGSDGKQNEYLANEEDIARLISMSASDSFLNKLIADMELDKAYDLDIRNNEDLTELRKIISMRLSIYMAEDNNVVLHYFDKQPERTAKVANYCVPVLERNLRTFYNAIRADIYGALSHKIAQQDSTIMVLTDTLVALRERYDIYDLVNPSRHNIMSSTVKNTGKPGFALGMELVQNIESIKDEMVASRAGNITLLGQYTTGSKLDDQSLITIIKAASVPVKPELTLLIILVLCVVVGVFFTSMYVVYAHYFYNRSSPN